MEATWEPATCFENGSEEILQEYRLRHRLGILTLPR
jgi:hypothetical protein